jgi:lantibiotic modifying enzyme
MNTEIKQKIDLIAECIFNKIEKSTEEESYGLYTGEFGILLFLFYYSKYSKSDKYRLLTENYAEILFNRFLNKTKLHTFCNGFSGILYLFEFLRENDFIDMDVSNSQSLLDNYLITRMRNDIHQQKYDFMHGALGVGLYFLKKGTNSQYIQELIDFLYHTAEKDTDNQIFKWKSIISYEKNFIGYNLSLSHGISSIIIFLTRTVNVGQER